MPTTAILGAAHIHTPNFIKTMNARDDVTVKYVYDHDSERAKAAAEKLAAEVSSLHDVLADSEVEAVVVCSETDRHEDIISAVVDAKKHLFVEKPLGFAAEDANKMAKAIEDAGLTFQTGYFQRGFAYNQFLKKHIEAGSFGQITRLRHDNCHAGALGGWFDGEWRWMADPAQAGVGAFGDLGTHSLDILLWFMGEVERVTADIRPIINRYEGCDETGESFIRFKNGVSATLAAGWVDVAQPVKLEICGTEGHAVVINDELFFKSSHVEGADGETPWTDLPDALPHAFELFFDALTGKDVPLVGASEAAYRNVVMAALYEASEKKAWVSL